MTIFEVRYDDDDQYFVAARYSDQGEAQVLRRRLLAAHQAADLDDCHFDEAWTIVPGRSRRTTTAGTRRSTPTLSRACPPEFAGGGLRR